MTQKEERQRKKSNTKEQQDGKTEERKTRTETNFELESVNSNETGVSSIATISSGTYTDNRTNRKMTHIGNIVDQTPRAHNTDKEDSHTETRKNWFIEFRTTKDESDSEDSDKDMPTLHIPEAESSDDDTLGEVASWEGQDDISRTSDDDLPGLLARWTLDDDCSLGEDSQDKRSKDIEAQEREDTEDEDFKKKSEENGRTEQRISEEEDQKEEESIASEEPEAPPTVPARDENNPWIVPDNEEGAATIVNPYKNNGPKKKKRLIQKTLRHLRKTRHLLEEALKENRAHGDCFLTKHKQAFRFLFQNINGLKAAL